MEQKPCRLDSCVPVPCQGTSPVQAPSTMPEKVFREQKFSMSITEEE